MDAKKQIAEYLRKVDTTVSTAVAGGELVILAAVDYLAGIYRSVSRLPNIASVSIGGNPETAGTDYLHAMSLPIARQHFDHARIEQTERYLKQQREGNTLNDPAAAVQAARHGRLDTVFVPIGVHVWGSVGSDGEVRIAGSQDPPNEDLLNRILIDTWKTGGRVFALPPEQIPGGGIFAATTRFSQGANSSISTLD
jgi:hypothetical protein